MDQVILTADNGYCQLIQYIRANNWKKIFLVCGRSFSSLAVSRYLTHIQKETGTVFVFFSDFEPNPHYSSVISGVKRFCQENCDSIFAVGGGSAIDVAKCIKLFAHLDTSISYLQQAIIPNDIRLFVLPTTAGSGSEATRYAVIYDKGQKQSIADISCIPCAIVYDPSVLQSLPPYQKKSAMMDALCHAIESFWSVNSTKESQEYSKKAIQLILRHMNGYLANQEEHLMPMFQASHLAGKAINITQTTAGHAMCYQLTRLYGIAHGHAAALCVRQLWPYMLTHQEQCTDPRGGKYLAGMFLELSEVFVNGMRETEALQAGIKETDMGQTETKEAIALDEATALGETEDKIAPKATEKRATKATIEKNLAKNISARQQTGYGAEIFGHILKQLELPVPEIKETDILFLASSINPVRLKNNPIALGPETAGLLYREILSNL